MDGLRVHTPEALRAFAKDVRLSPGLETGGTVFLTGIFVEPFAKVGRGAVRI